MHLERPSVLLAGVSCNVHATHIFNTALCTSKENLCFFRVLSSVHVTQFLDAALCTVDRASCFELEHNAEVQIVESGAVEYSKAVCAVAPDFLM